ncbi:M23 family metallopeptidase [Helicobacter zhangjianzhongii]|uniref:M23 family metallopeptidase n=1 Tax=Helicobacter zhangjianzhongii TaxID=2974574 RepID=A0ACC6FQ13_9HELI|nr:MULTISPECIES: M23 family metallopeptidase [unclassified Helicobacter]MDL0079294.1 M23 family metallopeptidase [Helicobacter sp. CPD2-1]MDL0081325.1 M23 family metallopeptidase [Helicobacter sp. XJK30-2]
MIFDQRLVLMITHKDGSKYVNVNMIFRQITLYVLLFFLSVVFFIAVAIGVFRSEIADINAKTSLIEERNETMLLGNAILNDEINQRLQEISIASDKIDNLENVIGVNNMPNENLVDRVDIASITGVQKAFFMKFIPNGYPLESFSSITDPYGTRLHPVLKVVRQHTGTDFGARIGTSVYATADGVVDWADSGWNGGYGKLVKITHSFGFKTYYAHLNEVLIKAGSFVKKGQLIAKTGNSGVSTGPHLHYEVRFLEKPIDPMNFARWDMKNFDSIFTKERSIAWQSLLATINNLMD